MADLISVAGLWMQEGKNGKFMAGTLKGKDVDAIVDALEQSTNSAVRVLVFKNDKDGNEKRPDYRITVTPDNYEGKTKVKGKAKSAGKKADAEEEAPF